MNHYRILFLFNLVLAACNKKPSVNEDDFKMDFRYVPARGQTSICLPDEVQKAIVDDKLITGTMNMLKCNECEGLVYETGWQDKGVRMG